MKTTFIVCAFLAATAVANAQNGANIGMGGSEGNYASLAEKVAEVYSPTPGSISNGLALA